MTLAMQHGGLWVGTGLNYNNTKASQRGDVNYLASSAGPMAQTPGDASAGEMNAGDLETARAVRPARGRSGGEVPRLKPPRGISYGMLEAVVRIAEGLCRALLRGPFGRPGRHL